MRSWFYKSAAVFVFVVAVASPCLAQNPSGPRTLEGLLNADGAQHAPSAPVAEPSTAGPNRPAGTAARPRDGVQHPELDKAWAEYDAAVAKAAEAIKAVILKQFDAATAKGDLDAAEKWQAALEKFERAGEVPADAEARAAVNATVTDYKKAKEILIKAYESVIKSLTMEKKIAEAKAARNEKEKIDLSKVTVRNQHGGKPPLVKIFLSDLQERDTAVGWGEFGKNGSLGYGEGDGRIRVDGVVHKKGLSMHARDNAPSKATFDVPDGCTRFEAIAAINDTARTHQRTPLIFKVFSEKGLLWMSRPLLGGGRAEKCSIALKGSKVLMLVVECPGDSGYGQAVWCDPCFSND
jgi:hypothetical protein